MKKERTTISLCEEAADCLKDGAAKLGVTPVSLAVLCLKLRMHRRDISLPEKVDGRFPKGTVTYNPLPAVRRLHIRLEPEEHMNVQLYRVGNRVSVSFAACGAILEYVPRLLKLYEEHGDGLFELLKDYLLAVDCAAKAYHINFGFRHQNTAQIRITTSKFRGKWRNPRDFLEVRAGRKRGRISVREIRQTLALTAAAIALGPSRLAPAIIAARNSLHSSSHRPSTTNNNKAAPSFLRILPAQAKRSAKRSSAGLPRTVRALADLFACAFLLLPRLLAALRIAEF